MEAIFHEKQEGSLCAQHCLNALLQGSYFSPVDLADIAGQLDESERERMAEGGVYSDEYHYFLQQPSNNFDDSGFFSIQVINKALNVWGLELIQYNSQDPVALAARQQPIQQKAFICNFKEHWFSIRKLGNQWFNLNSLLTGPELISNTYLQLFLKQLQQEGYSILLVIGQLPDCEADELLRIAPAIQPIKPRLINEATLKKGPQSQMSDHDGNLESALEQSRSLHDNDDQVLQSALKLSMEGYTYDTNEDHEPQTSSYTQPSSEEIRLRRLAYLDRIEGKSPQISLETRQEGGEQNDEDMLRQAIEMSMEKP